MRSRLPSLAVAREAGHLMSVIQPFPEASLAASSGGMTVSTVCPLGSVMLIRLAVCHNQLRCAAYRQVGTI